PTLGDDRGHCGAQTGALLLAHRLFVRAVRHGDGGEEFCCAVRGARDLFVEVARPRRPPSHRRNHRRQDARVPLPRFPRRRLRGRGAGGVLIVCIERVLMMRARRKAVMGFASLTPSYERGTLAGFPSPHSRSEWGGGVRGGGRLPLAPRVKKEPPPD